MKNFFLTVIVIGSIGISGCTTAPVTLDGDSFVPKSRSKFATVSTRADACAVHVRSFDDARSQKASLGWVAGRPLEAKDFSVMVREGFVDELNQSEEFRVVHDIETIEPAVTVDGEVLKAYMKSMSTSMIANVAVRLRFTLPDGQSDVRTIRGHNTSVNWVSGEGEVKRSLSLALVDVATQVRHVLARKCSQLNGAPGATSVR